MNTDASNVEDMNIPQTEERLSRSCIAYFEEWSSIFRNRPFTLCKNVLDFHESSDSVKVSESVSSSSTINLSVCCVNTQAGCSLAGLTVLTPIIHQISTLEKTTCPHCSILWSLMSKRPKQVSLFFVAAHSSSSKVFDFQMW